MIDTKQILHDIQLRIDNLKLELKQAPNSQRLKSNLSIQEGAYEFNEWLAWRKLTQDPRLFGRRYD